MESRLPQLLVGVDIGGTFTDCIVLGESGRITMAKAPSTPPSFAQGALHAVSAAARQLGLDSETELLTRTRLFFHATTVGDNAIYTRSGAVTGLVTTTGFGDTLAMMRGDVVTGLRDDEAAHIAAVKPDPIVPRALVAEVEERIDWRGVPLVGLTAEAAVEALDRLADAGAQAVAVCLLWSFRNAEHERCVASLARRHHPELYVSLSSDVAPYLGEYERTATTAFNAYIGPVVASYLQVLERELLARGLASRPLIMQSYGGVTNVDMARAQPIGTVESGPVAGVMAARAIAGTVGRDTVLAIDMGGTTFKVGVIRNGRLEREPSPPLLRYRVVWPKVWVESMGSGGGSIARLDPVTGHVKVGPEGAGAVPGPACYGQGGTEPTVTDADLVLGLLNPGYFLGGAIALDLRAAQQAIQYKIAEPLGLDITDAAEGIVRIADAQMADLIKAATIRRGYDPRTMTLVAYGGAGPVHARNLAAQLGIRQAVIPATAAVHGAFGLVVSDVAREYGTSVYHSFPPQRSALESQLRELVDRGVSDLLNDGYSPSEVSIECGVDMRYGYQVNEITVPMEWTGGIGVEELDGLSDTFDRMYEEKYGKGAGYREAGREIVALRVRAVGKTERPVALVHDRESGDCHVTSSTRLVWFPGVGRADARVVRVSSLRAGAELPGPAIIETPVTTIVVYPGDRAQLDEHGNVEMEIQL